MNNETKELLQKLANAVKTYYNCSGHGKSYYNEIDYISTFF